MTSGTDDDDYEDEDIPDEDEDGGSGPGFLTTPPPSEGEPGIHFLCNYILSFNFFYKILKHSPIFQRCFRSLNLLQKGAQKKRYVNVTKVANPTFLLLLGK